VNGDLFENCVVGTQKIINKK